MDIACDFLDRSWFFGNFYTCRIRNQSITEDSTLNFHGQHKDNRSNSDVIGLWFYTCQLSELPSSITKTFPNLKFLDIFNSELENLTRLDLVDYQNCHELCFTKNKIEFLSADLFDDFLHLEVISFGSNQLKLIEPAILDKLKNLKHISFANNPNYSTCYSTVFPKSTLDEVKQELAEKFNSVPEFEIDLIKKNQQKRKKPATAKFYPTLFEVMSSASANFDVNDENFDKIEAEMNFLHLFAAAGNLQIEYLKNHAAVKLLEQIDGENAFEILKLSNKYQHDELRQKAFDEIKKKYPKTNFKDELAVDVEKLEEIIEGLEEKNAIESQLDEKLQKLLI